MITKVKRWVDGRGLHLSKDLLLEAGLKVGDEVRVSVRGGRIIVESLRKVRGRHTLKELVARIPKGFCSPEIDGSEPLGIEAW